MTFECECSLPSPKPVEAIEQGSKVILCNRCDGAIKDGVYGVAEGYSLVVDNGWFDWETPEEYSINNHRMRDHDE